MGASEDRTTSAYGKGDNYPIYYVSWYDAIVFCNKLSITDGLTPVYSIVVSGADNTNPEQWGTIPTSINAVWNAVKMDKNANGYRLPTEAEWEYACRADTTTAYSYGDTANGDYMWFIGNNMPNGTKPVGTKKPNPWGLYDMHGNVWEWCWDWYGVYVSGTQTDPTGPASSPTGRIVRGGPWQDTETNLRSAYRWPGFSPTNRHYLDGFRLVRGK